MILSPTGQDESSTHTRCNSLPWFCHTKDGQSVVRGSGDWILLQLSHGFRSLQTLSISVLILRETVNEQFRDGHWPLNHNVSRIAPDLCFSNRMCLQITWRSCSGAHVDPLHLGGPGILHFRAPRGRFCDQVDTFVTLSTRIPHAHRPEAPSSISQDPPKAHVQPGLCFRRSLFAGKEQN